MLTSTNADTKIAIGGTGTLALLTELGIAVGTDQADQPADAERGVGRARP